MIEQRKVTELADHEISRIIFDHFNIETKGKTYLELIDDVDAKLQTHLKMMFCKYGKEACLEKFKNDTDTILLQMLLTHLSQLHQWIKA